LTSTTKQAEYSRRHYELNAVSIRKKNRVLRDIARARNREYVMAAKADRPCSLCDGSFHPAAMDFHHVGPKTMNIGEMASRGVSLERLQLEIDQCRLICANCHRTLHATE
jgi:hypothetical protein